MISLHVYLNSKSGKERELEAVIRDSWIAAMSEQPGLVSAAILNPFPDDELAKMEAAKSVAAFEVISFWQSEELRLEWVARPIHDRVFMPLFDLADDVSFTLQSVAHDWNI